MADLKPTPARLALLQAVADGAVTEQYGIFPSADEAVWDRYDAPSRIVTGKARELYLAGWIRLGDKVHNSYKAPRLFEITEAGQAVLAAVGG